MPDQEGRNARDTWDGTTSPGLFKLRALSSEPERLKKDTIRIPVKKSDMIEMNESDFIQYVVKITDTARSLVHKVLEGIEDTQAFITEWAIELKVDNESFDVEAVLSHVKDRINSIDTFELLSLSTEDSEDFDAAKELLEKVKKTLEQWIEVRKQHPL
ncbi:hypothetical protein ACFL10_02190 [Patescibacteria group bacterium]